jgi:general secretion pathway protein A
MLALLLHFSVVLMYNQFFNLKQAPFSIAPDPRYLFMSERHREALAHLLYGVSGGGGFVLLTGEIGAGKTTICRCFLEQVPDNCNVAYIFNPKLTVNDLLQSICDEFHIQVEHKDNDSASVKAYVNALTTYLLATHAEGQNNVLIIDEAQNLSADVLEQLRLLTNLETSERKLLQIILIGQPELREMLSQPSMEQLAQRVIARYHLDALSAQETRSYIFHRLSVAGTTAVPPFSPRLIKEIYRLTRGVPRRINLLCDRALLGAYSEGKHQADLTIIKKAAKEVFTPRQYAATSIAIKPWQYALGGFVLCAALAGPSLWLISSKLNPAASKSGASAIATPQAGAVVPAALVSTASNMANVNQGKLDASVIAGSSPRNDAIRQLAQLWGVTLKDGIPCQVAQAQNLHCYISNSNELGELRQLDRPAVLSLRDGANKKYYALLTGMTDDVATLRVGSKIRSVGLTSLARGFDGGFLTMWRAPQTYRDYVWLNHHGEDVDWVAAQLAKANGTTAPATNQPFDRKLRQQVRELQFAKGITADGMVGPESFMYLNRIAGVSEPRLQVAAANAANAAKALPGK